MHVLHHDADTAAQAFITRWSGVTASELATAQSFVIDLCALLGLDKPHPTPEQDYMFERPVAFMHGDGSTSPGRIDCYRRGHFVLEAKKFKAPTHTKGFDDGLLRARNQAEGYAPALPATLQRPGHAPGVRPLPAHQRTAPGKLGTGPRQTQLPSRRAPAPGRAVS